MVLLAELPTDILVIVVSYLPPADKATISRVCKWLQHFAEPILYADIRLIAKYHPGKALDVHLLLLKLLAIPELASHVKRVHASGWNDSYSLTGPRYDWRTNPKFQIVSKLARRAAKPSDEDLWVNMARDTYHGIYQTLIISQLPNLTELTVANNMTSTFESIGKMLLRILCPEKTTDGLSKFQHLKRVDLCVDIMQRDYSSPLRGERLRLSHLLPFFYLPSIEYLRMIMPHDHEDFRWPGWPGTPPCTESLTSLSLNRSSASEALLGRILAVTPNLKCLEYHFICEGTPLNGPTSLCAEGLGKALAHVKATLERLTISVHFLRWCPYHAENFASQFGIKGSLSLHDYESLVMLEVPIAMLLGYKPSPQTRLTGRLPPRTRQLCLRGDEIRCASEWKGEVVLGLLREHFIQYPAQVADFETLELYFDWDDKSLDEFQDFYNESRINLKLIRRFASN